MAAPASIRSCLPPRGATARRGQVLVEFAVVSVILYLLLAAVFELGRALYVAQVLQSAAELAARELARTPLPVVHPDGSSYTLTDALADPRVRAQVYDESRLVFDFAPGESSDGSPQLHNLPLVNQLLRAVMISEPLPDGGFRLRYPGMLVEDEQGNPRVLIPRLSADGTQIDAWLPVVEEIAGADPSASPFALSSAERGLVALRINYPFQAASLVGGVSDPQQPFGQAARPIQPIAADDAALGVVSLPDDLQPATAQSTAGPYAGPYSLGRLYAYPGTAAGQGVRPYRKILSSQAICRRELFESAPSSPDP